MKKGISLLIGLAACGPNQEGDVGPTAALDDVLDTPIQETGDTDLGEIVDELPPTPDYSLRTLGKDLILSLTPDASGCEPQPGFYPQCERHGPMVGDIDNDGNVEYVFVNFLLGSDRHPIFEYSSVGGVTGLARDEVFPTLGSLLNYGLEFGPTLPGDRLGNISAAGIIDIDGDGLLDVLIPQNYGDPDDQFKKRVGYLSQSDGQLTGIDIPGDEFGTLFNIQAVDQADIDNDGLADLIFHVEASQDPIRSTRANTFFLYNAGGGKWVVDREAVREGEDQQVNAVIQLNLSRLEGDISRRLVVAGDEETFRGFSAHPNVYLQDGVTSEGYPTFSPDPDFPTNHHAGTMMGASFIRRKNGNEWFDSFVIGDSHYQAQSPSEALGSSLVTYDRQGSTAFWYELQPEQRDLRMPFTPGVEKTWLPWGVTTRIDTNLDGLPDILGATGDDGGSTRMQDLDSFDPGWYWDAKQGIYCHEGKSDGTFDTSCSDRMVIDGEQGVEAQPLGSYLGQVFVDLQGNGKPDSVWLGSWLDDRDIEIESRYGSRMRSWAFENVTATDTYHGISFLLQGTSSNRQGIGAQIYLTPDAACADHITATLQEDPFRRGFPQEPCEGDYQWQHVGDNSAHIIAEPYAFFGTGIADLVEAVIHWPSGHIQRESSLVSDRLHEIVEDPTISITGRRMLADGTSEVVLHYTPRNQFGDAKPLTSLDVQISGVPMPYTIDSAAGEIIFTAPNRDTFERYIVENPSAQGSAQIAIIVDGVGLPLKPRIYFE